MKRDVLERGNELTAEIERLNKEIVELPVNKLLRKYKFKAGGYIFRNFEIELTKDDIKALIDLRLKQIEKLEKELEEL